MDRTPEQVDASRYDEKYFRETFAGIDFSKPVSLESFGKNYRQMADMAPPSPDDLVVDYGCGNGHLCFYLHLRCGCRALGIDYSKDAIDQCLKSLEGYRRNQVGADRISFLNRNNEELPALEGVSTVFFCDVFEHLYDHEIELVLKAVSSWNAKPPVKLVVRTDNELFVRCIRPFLDGIGVLMGVTARDAVEARNAWERDRHVNLTTPTRLARKMRAWGYRQTALRYPTATQDLVQAQLGPMQRIPGLVQVSLALVKAFSFASPSFCAVYER